MDNNIPCDECRRRHIAVSSFIFHLYLSAYKLNSSTHTIMLVLVAYASTSAYYIWQISILRLWSRLQLSLAEKGSYFTLESPFTQHLPIVGLVSLV